MLPSGTNGQLIANDDELFYFANKYNGTPVIYRMNLDGSNRRIAYSFESGSSFFSGVASDSSTLFFLTLMVNDATGVGKTQISALSLDTGHLYNIAEFEEHAFLFGASGRNLIIRFTLEDSQYALASICVDTGKTTIIRTWDIGNEIGLCDEKDYVCIDFTDLTIKAYDLLTGEMRTLINDIPVVGDDGTYVVNDLIDGHFMYTTMLPTSETYFMESTTYAVETSSGELGIINLMLDNLGYKYDLVDIVAQTENHFLVRNAIKEFNYDLRLRDGTVQNGNYPQACFALISKSDFWNSIENYLPITNTLF